MRYSTNGSVRKGGFVRDAEQAAPSRGRRKEGIHRLLLRKSHDHYDKSTEEPVNFMSGRILGRSATNLRSESGEISAI